MKIVICGGHHNSALIIAKMLKESKDEVFWFGHKFSMLTDKNLSAEYLEVTQAKIPFFEIRAGKLQTNFKFWQNLLRIPLGFWDSFKFLLKLRPKVVVSFGGYLALPVATCAFLLRIPVVTHEQTVVAGVANKIIAKMAKKVLVAFPSSSAFFPSKKVVITGLPLRKEIFYQGKKLFSNGLKTIYFTGGKQGAHVINEAVFATLPQLLEKFNVIHQCGSNSQYNDFKKGTVLKESLEKLSGRYLLREYFFEDEIGKVYYSADFLVSRAGAHTIYELLVLQKPAILIPIPWSNNNEQQKNAQMVKDLGLAEIYPQNEILTANFLKAVIDFSEKISSYKLNPSFTLSASDPAKKIVSVIKSVVG